MTRDELMTAFPVHGRVITTDKGRWTVRLDDIREKVPDAFVVTLTLVGEPPYATDLHLNRRRLSGTPEDMEREIDQILRDVHAWLATNPPRGARQLL